MSENAVEQVASAEFPTRWGKFRIYGFRGHSEGKVDRRIEEAVALRNKVLERIETAPGPCPLAVPHRGRLPLAAL